MCKTYPIFNSFSNVMFMPLFLTEGTKFLRLNCYLLAGMRLRGRFLLGTFFSVMTKFQTDLALILALVPARVRSRVGGHSSHVTRMDVVRNIIGS